MGNIQQLAMLIGQTVARARQQARVQVGQLQGNSVVANGVAYKPDYAADIDAADGQAVYVIVQDGQATVISDR